MTNIYLEKIASSKPLLSRIKDGIKTGWKEATPTQKLLIGLGSSGTVVGGLNLIGNGTGNSILNFRRQRLEEQSLHELEKIRKAVANQPAPVLKLTAPAIRELQKAS